MDSPFFGVPFKQFIGLTLSIVEIKLSTYTGGSIDAAVAESGRKNAMPNKLRSIISLGVSICVLSACSKQSAPLEPELNFGESLQQQLILAQAGDVIEIPAGKHELVRGLSLSVAGVTIRGEGMDRSVLSFRDQMQGAEGLLVNANDFTIENLAIEDTVGDAIKINESENIVIRNVRTEWTGGPSSTNGAYGIYPVHSSNILIDGAVAIGASDAGIYVG